MNRDDPKSRYYARTMHTPDDPVRAELRAALRDMSRALMPLHRSLIEAAKSDYMFAEGPVTSPGQLLQLLQTDPFFEWLKPVTSLIVDIDETTRTDFAQEEVTAIVDRIDRLFGSASDQDFAARYVPILQREVDVATGHAAVRKALAKLTK